MTKWMLDTLHTSTATVRIPPHCDCLYSTSPHAAAFAFTSPPTVRSALRVKSVYSHGGPIRRRKRGHILTADQSDAGSAGKFSRRTNQTQEAQVNSHDGPIRRRKR
eukprot:1005296-Prorocentrum_minimum.AAC.2